MAIDIRTFRGALCALVFAAPAAALAQAAAPAAPPAPPAIPSPIYETLVLETTVAKPAAEVWAKIGGYCEISKWGAGDCVITSGKSGELGAVHTINGTNIEMLVAKTDLSYTYTQPVRVGVPFNAYHGTLEVKPVTEKVSKIVYAFIYDVSMVPPADRPAAKQARVDRFGPRLQLMKTMVEGG